MAIGEIVHDDQFRLLYQCFKKPWVGQNMYILLKNVLILKEKPKVKRKRSDQCQPIDNQEFYLPFM